MIYRKLMHGGKGWTRDEIDRMTDVEIALACDDDLEKKRHAAGTVEFSGPAAYALHCEYVRWWRSLTPRDKLERARRKWQGG